MFTTEDLLTMDDNFDFLYVDDSTIEMQSKNTRRYWVILIEGPKAYRCLHKHHFCDTYHSQSLFDVILDIVFHDEYQLRGRRSIKYPH